MLPLINKRETGINLRRIMDMRGVTANQVQEFLHLGCVQSVYRWLDGVNLPTIDNLYALSELLQVPMDALVRGNRAYRMDAQSWESGMLMDTMSGKDTVLPDIYSLSDARARRLYAYCEKLNRYCVA